MTRAADLLRWYDANARDLPWRTAPAARRAGARPDPYHVWLSEIMLQQTTVAAVGPYFAKFLARWPDIHALAAAEDDAVMAAWAGLGYYARARNLLRCARTVSARGGAFPVDEAALRELPGIGPYTAAAIAAIAFDRPATVMDGNVERVMARLHAVETPLPQAKPLLRDLAAALTPARRPGDYAQAVMDLGATVCTPRTPSCGICPWAAGCKARATGRAADFPLKTPKTPKPVRHGAVYFAMRRDGAVLLERRAPDGLLGGMMGLPGGAWAEDAPEAKPPVAADWIDTGAEVRHTFTHFHLRLRVLAARVENAPGHFRPREEVEGDLLPTVMKKAARIGFAALDASGPVLKSPGNSRRFP